ncbi:MAG: hypothetical protein GY697_14415 [Desulfobacterales bacterium]|nr:hypothetical protein [Desulfobacterales bacterium]
MAAEPLVRVVGLGLDARFRSMLDVFFLRSCNGNYEITDDLADVIVVDMDAMGAREAYLAHRKSNGKMPSILFSLNEKQYQTKGNIVLLRKPFTVRQLQSAFEIITIRFLNVQDRKTASRASRSTPPPTTRIVSEEPRDKADELKEHLLPDEAEESTNGNQAKALPSVSGRKKESASASRAAFSLARHDEYIKLNSLLPEMAGDDSKNEEQTYEPKHYLQHELKLAHEQARKAGKNALMKLGGATITIDPAQGLVQMGIGRFQLREVSSFPLNNHIIKVVLVPETEARVDRDGKSQVLRLQELIWQTALYAAQGRVPAGVELDTQVQLRHWPNLTRLMLTSGSVRMAALWVVQPASVTEIATRLGLSVRDVAVFYSAAHALGLFLTRGDAGESEPRPEPKPEVRRGGVLRRILQRLRA